MAYKKQQFVNNTTILTAEHLNHMEDGIYENSVAIDAITIPTKLSQLTNDTGYLTEHQSLSDYAKTSDITEWTLGQIQAAIDATWEASY